LRDPQEKVRDTAYLEDASTVYAGNGPQVMATFRNIAISLLYLADVTEITRTFQVITRDLKRMLSYLPLWNRHHKGLCRPRGVRPTISMLRT
jgi:hypothetical protein